MKLEGMSMATLVAMVNELGGNATMKTFSQRSKAVDRITKLASDSNIVLEAMFDEEGNRRPADEEVYLLTRPKAPVDEAPTETEASNASLSDEQAPETDEPETVEEAKPAEAPKDKPKKARPVSIRTVAEAKLMEVVSTDANSRKVGLSYQEILDYLHANFEGSKTTVACLRWYAAHMRERGVLPPNRPRAVPKKAEPQVAESATNDASNEKAA